MRSICIYHEKKDADPDIPILASQSGVREIAVIATVGWHPDICSGTPDTVQKSFPESLKST